MNEAWKEYCEYVVKVSSHIMDQINEVIRTMMLTEVRAKGANERF